MALAKNAFKWPGGGIPASVVGSRSNHHHHHRQQLRVSAAARSRSRIGRALVENGGHLPATIGALPLPQGAMEGSVATQDSF